MTLLVFCHFELKIFFQVPTPWGLCGAEWDEHLCSLRTFQLFLPSWGLGDLGDPVIPTLRGVSGDVVRVYAY